MYRKLTFTWLALIDFCLGSRLASFGQEARHPQDTLLSEAIQAQDVAKIASLLDQGVDPNARNSQHYPALTLAVGAQNEAMVRLLLKHHAEVDALYGNERRTALMGSVALGNSRIAHLLISAGANVNARDAIGTPVLMQISRNARAPQIVTLLASAGADLNIRDREGRTALMTDTLYGAVEVVRALLSHGAKVNLQDPEGNTALHYTGLWSYRADLVAVSESQAIAIASVLIQKGAAIDRQNAVGRTPLMIACENDHSLAADGLLLHGAKVQIHDALGRTALTFAAHRGDHDALVQHLLQRGVKPTLIDTLVLGKPERIGKDLLPQEKERFRGPYGETALMIAGASNRLEIARQLLDCGAEVNSQDAQGYTALMLAIGGRPIQSLAGGLDFPRTTESRAPMIALLLSHKARVDLKSQSGATAWIGLNNWMIRKASGSLCRPVRDLCGLAVRIVCSYARILTDA